MVQHLYLYEPIFYTIKKLFYLWINIWHLWRLQQDKWRLNLTVIRHTCQNPVHQRITQTSTNIFCTKSVPFFGTITNSFMKLVLTIVAFLTDCTMCQTDSHTSQNCQSSTQTKQRRTNYTSHLSKYYPSRYNKL